MRLTQIIATSAKASSKQQVAVVFVGLGDKQTHTQTNLPPKEGKKTKKRRRKKTNRQDENTFQTHRGEDLTKTDGKMVDTVQVSQYDHGRAPGLYDDLNVDKLTNIGLVRRADADADADAGADADADADVDTIVDAASACAISRPA